MKRKKWKSQPCWHCENFAGGCSWTRKYPKPVEGWDAVPTARSASDHTMHSYKIYSCPEFKSNGTEDEKPKKEIINKPKNKNRLEYSIDGLKLKLCIESRGMTYSTFANKCEMTAMSMHKYIIEKGKPTRETAKKMAMNLGLTYEELRKEIERIGNDV